MTTTLEQSTDLAIDRSTSQELSPHRNSIVPSEPTIEQILYLAVDRGQLDALERIVALKERSDAAKAERELNNALQRFRTNLPQILKTRDVKNKAGDSMYKFANLEDVKSIVDPRLAENDLSYSWDGEFINQSVVTICTVRHIGGGKRSAKFASPVSAAPAMNAAQASASTVTFGQRYSLLAVLGISADLDDDGRSANALPKPEHDPTAPVVPTRDERKAAAQAANQSTSAAPPQGGSATAPPQVTAAEVTALYNGFCAGMEEKPTAEFFTEWCRQNLGVAKDVDLKKARNWTPEMVKAIEEKLS